MPRQKRVPSAASKTFVTRKRGKELPPTVRTPTSFDRELSPQERLHELLEERSLRKKWDRGEIPATLKGLSTVLNGQEKV